MNEQRPPFGTWILEQTDLPADLANAIAKAAHQPDWPRFGDWRTVDRYINPNPRGAGVGSIEEAFERYKAQFPDA